MITFMVLAAIIFTLMIVGVIFGVGVVLVFLDWIVFGLVVYAIYKLITTRKA